MEGWDRTENIGMEGRSTKVVPTKISFLISVTVTLVSLYIKDIR